MPGLRPAPTWGCATRNLACEAVREDAPLPALYHKLYRIWFACGFPAFAAVLAIIRLMLEKPDLGRLF